MEMNFTLTFSHVVNGQRVPLLINGHEATLQVEANDKTGAIYHQLTVDFCKLHSCRVRRVL